MNFGALTMRLLVVMLSIVQAGQALSLSASYSNEEMQEYLDSL